MMAGSCRNCWKQGPSIDNLTRKRIWEENYRTRESLRGVQQSEHFWSFQMTPSGCCCMAPLSLPKKFSSMQSLDKLCCSSHCERHCKGDRTPIPLKCQVQSSFPEATTPYHRDVATETSRPLVDKSVGPEYRPRQVQLAFADDPQSRLIDDSRSCPRHKPRDLNKNESNNAKQYRQQRLQRLRKNEEALQQSLHRSKKGIGNIGNWGTEYTRSFKEGPMSRIGTCMPRHMGGRETPMLCGLATPLPRHAEG